MRITEHRFLIYFCDAMWTKNTDIRIAKWGGTCFDDIVTSGIYGLTLNDLNSETRGDYGASIS